MGTTTYGCAYDAIGRRAGSGSTSKAVPHAASGHNRYAHITTKASTSNVCGLDLQETDTIGDHLSGICSTSSMVAFYSYDAAGTHYEHAPLDTTTEARHPLASENPWQFSTKQADDWGLYYYGLRSYSPELGRWLSRDPIGERGGHNLHVFVGNRSTDGLDRLGLEKCGVFVWVGHSTSTAVSDGIRDEINKPEYKARGKCLKHGAFGCHTERYINLADDHIVANQPVIDEYVGGDAPIGYAWPIEYEGTSVYRTYYRDGMSWYDWNLAIVRDVFSRAYGAYARLILEFRRDPKRCCECKCDTLTFEVHRIPNSRITGVVDRYIARWTDMPSRQCGQ